MANLYDKAGLVNIPVGYQDGFLYNIKPEDNTLGFRFNRDSAATRVNKEGLIEQVGYFGPELVQNGNFSELGPDLIVNGNFATDSDWNKGDGVTISNGKANWNNTINNKGVAQNGALTIGKTYKVEFTVSNYVSGSVRVRFPFIEQRIQANGTYIFYGVATTDGLYIQGETQGGDPNFSVDNVSAKQVDPNNYWTLDTGWSFGNNVASSDGTQAGNSSLFQGNVLTQNKFYKFEFTLSNVTAGSVRLRNGVGASETYISYKSANGTYFSYAQVNQVNTTLVVDADSNFVGSVSNVSVTEVLGDKPRIDYTDSLTSPSFLLEPQSTNLVEFSEDFSKWNNTDITIGENGISPTGETNANLIQTGTANSDQVNETFTISATNTATYSIFIKRVSGAEWIDFLVVKSGFSNSLKVWFNISSGLVGSNVANGTTTFDSASVKDFGNGWYRLKVTTTDTTNNTSFNIRVRTASADASDTRVSNSSYYLWGAQLEQLSYPTSYIPTAGSTVTRAQETCSDAGNASTFNDSEGVLYAEIAALGDSSVGSYYSLSDGTSSNRIRIGYSFTNNTIRALVVSQGSSVVDYTHTVSDTRLFSKIVFSYKQNDFSFWIDGIKVHSDTSGNTPINLSRLSFDDGKEVGTGGYFYGKTKSIYVFNEVLTDDELQQLTGPEYNSFAALAAAYNYTVI